MASIKITDLNNTTNLESDSLFLVVLQLSNKNLSFHHLSSLITDLVNDNLGINTVKSTVDNLITETGSLRTDINQTQASLDQFKIDIQNKQASETEFGLIKLSSFTDNDSRTYGVTVDETGHAYVNVPWTEGGGGGSIVLPATDTSLGVIKTHSTLMDDTNLNYGLRKNDLGLAYVHINVPSPYMYEEVSAFAFKWYDNDKLDTTIANIKTDAATARLSASAAYTEVYKKDPETGLDVSRLDEFQTSIDEHESIIGKLSILNEEISSAIFYEEGGERKSKLDDIKTNIEEISSAIFYEEGGEKKSKLDDIETAVSKNTTDIATNTASIAQNTTDIATNKSSIDSHSTKITNLETAVSLLIVKELVTCSNSYSVDAGSTLEVTDIPILKTSYTPISIVNVKTGNSNIVAGIRYIDDNKAFFTLTNKSTTSIGVTPVLTVIYFKSE